MLSSALSPLQRDTVLVIDVAGRVERALAERWHIEGDGLAEQISAMHRAGVPREAISQLHYLRKARNRVVHHPRAPLEDFEKFVRYAETVLPLIEGADSAQVFAASLESRMIDAIDESLDAMIEDTLTEVLTRHGKSIR